MKNFSEHIEEYTKIMNNHLKNIDQDILAIVKKHGYMLAGGAILDLLSGRTIKDYDFFPFSINKDFRNSTDWSWTDTTVIPSKPAYVDIYNELRSISKVKFNHLSLFHTANALTVFNKYQFIKNRHDVIGPDYIDTLNNFDFNICRIGYLPEEERFIAGAGFYEDFNNDKLTIDFNAAKRDRSDTPFSLLHRSLKYSYKGYKMSMNDITKIYMQLSNNELTTDMKLAEAFDTFTSEDYTHDPKDREYFKKFLKNEGRRIKIKSNLKRAVSCGKKMFSAADSWKNISKW